MRGRDQLFGVIALGSSRVQPSNHAISRLLPECALLVTPQASQNRFDSDTLNVVYPI